MNFKPKKRDDNIVLSLIKLSKLLNSSSSLIVNLANLARMEVKEEY